MSGLYNKQEFKIALTSCGVLYTFFLKFAFVLVCDYISFGNTLAVKIIKIV